MNVQELATIAKHALPVKIFLLNNHGHSMIRQTQDQWLDSNYFGSSIEGGLGFPDFVKLAEAYGIPAIEIHKNSAIDLTLSRVLEHAGPMLCNVEVRPEHSVTPQVKFGRPIEDSEPLLKRSEFYSNMITKPIS